MRTTIEKIIKYFNLLLYIMGGLCLVGFVGSILYQVVARNVLPKAPIWTEEAARFLFVYMVSFGAGIAVHTGDYVGVELLMDLLPKKAHKAAKIIIDLVLAAFCFWYFTVSVVKFAFFDYRYLSSAMQIPMQFVYKSMVILFPSLGISLVLSALLKLATKDREATPDMLEGGN